MGFEYFYLTNITKDYRIILCEFKSITFIMFDVRLGGRMNEQDRISCSNCKENRIV